VHTNLHHRVPTFTNIDFIYIALTASAIGINEFRYQLKAI